MNIRRFFRVSKNPNQGASQIALLYLLIGGLWILLSDKVATSIALNEEMLAIISIYKGWGYVIVTALLLYWLVKRNTAALRASETQLQQVIDAMPVLISYVDADGRYRFTNRTYEEWFGDMARGKTVEEVIGGNAYQAISKYINKALNGEIVSYESAMTYSQGERFINATYIPDKTTNGQVKGFFALVQDVTKNKQAEKALRESEERYRIVSELTSDYAYRDRVEADGSIIPEWFTESFTRITGYPLEETQTPGFWQRIVHPEDLPTFVRHTRQILSGQSDSVQIRVFTKSGEVRWLQDFANPIWDTDQNRTVGLYGAVQDITERKQVEAENESLARFPNENPNPVLRATYEGKIVYANAASELLLNDWHCQVGDDLPPEWLALLKELIQTGARRTRDVQCQDTTYSIVITPIPGANYVNLYGTDITERKRTETDLLNSMIQFRTLFEASPDAILLIDPHGNWPIMDCNTAACQMNGYTRDELIGQPIDLLNTSPLLLGKRGDYLEQIRQANVLRYETSHRRKDGTVFPLEVSNSLLTLGGRDVLLGIDRDITERRQAEETLRRFELLSEHSRDIILFLKREDGHILEANAAALQAYGYSYEELLGLTVQDLRSRHTQPLTAEQIAQADLAGLLFETIHVRRDGTTFPVEVSSRGANIGGMRTLISIVRDITERKRAERELRESQVRLNFALEKSHTGGWDLDLVDHTAFRTLEHDRIFGYETLLPEWTYEIFLGHVLLEDRDEVDRLFQEAITTQTNWSFECRIRRTDGKVRWISAVGGHLFDETGHPYRMAGIVQDITERKQAEEALQLKDRLLHMTSEMAKVGGWEFDTETLQGTWTDEVARIHDLDSAQETNVEIGVSFYIGESRARVAQAIQEAIESGTPYDLELELMSAKGVHKWVRTMGLPILKDGRVVKMRGIFQDITERKEAEDKIRHLNDELEQRVVERTAQLEAANKELEAFSYSVSHDLRAPLRAINGYARILLEDYEPKFDAEGKRICGVIGAEAIRMGQLIDDLLSFSRLGRKEMFKSKIDMKALVTSVFDELAKEQDRARLDFQVSKLPLARGDLALMHQVWVNLLANAIKFTSKKERAIIEVGGRQHKDENIYYVRDTGAGFDMEYADKLFGVFQRLHGESEFEGTGVGLAIVQRIIRRHGGRVWAEGEPEKGATFYFALPRKEGHQEM